MTPFAACVLGLALTAAPPPGDPPPPPSFDGADAPSEDAVELSASPLPDHLRPFAGLLGGGIGAAVASGAVVAASVAIAVGVVSAAMIVPVSVPVLVGSAILALALLTLAPGAAGIGASIGMLSAIGEADLEGVFQAVSYVVVTYVAVGVLVVAVVGLIAAVTLLGAALGGAPGALDGCARGADGCGKGCGNGGCGELVLLPPTLVIDTMSHDDGPGQVWSPALAGMAGTTLGAVAGGALAGAAAFGLNSVDERFSLGPSAALVGAGVVAGGLLGAAAGGALGGAGGVMAGAAVSE